MVENFFQLVAGFFGYPENSGMSTVYDMPNELYTREQVQTSLPKHETFFPPLQEPQSWFELIFGPAPKIDTVIRYIYESKEEGFYNFYIENYNNIYFLPDWLSEFLQIRLNQCLDISLLETLREVLFVGILIYYQIVILRISLSWLIYINPYTVPWCYLAAAVDWTEEVLTGLLPSVVGVNITGTVFLGFLGSIGDSLNHLVFTMPFLPGEGESVKLLVDGQMKNVIVFHYLPTLWYRYPIPNEVREFWYNERPEIFNYMEKAYKDLDLQLLPNQIIEKLNQQVELLTQNSITNNYSSIEMIGNLVYSDELTNQFISILNLFHLSF
jgi:hypothetical protein